MRTIRILWALPIVSFLCVPTNTRAQVQLASAQGEVGYQLPVEGLMRWTSNLLVGCDYCDGKPILWTVDSQANRESIAFMVPGADFVHVRDVASGPDRSLAAVGFAVSGSHRMGTFIAWISPDRTKQNIVRVWPFDPNVVAIAPDESIWAVGSVAKDTARALYDNVLRHYSPSGELLASTIIQGLRPQASGMAEVSNLSNLMASNDRIGWLTSSCQYIEFSFDAVEAGRYSCPNGATNSMKLAGVALSPGDNLLVGSVWLGPLTPLQLNRSTSTWTQVPVSQDSGKTWKILGFDSNALVTASTSSTMRRYAMSPAPAAGVAGN